MTINQHIRTIYSKYFVGENNVIHKKFQLECIRRMESVKDLDVNGKR